MKFAWVLGAGLACVALAGCGQSQPSRTPLQGKVTYEGKPVAYGVIHFGPDTARGNKGAFGTAEIRDGVYQTSPDYAPTLGPMLMNFQVYSGPPPDNRMIANVFDYPADIPSGSSSYDFNLTAKDVKPIRQ